MKTVDMVFIITNFEKINFKGRVTFPWVCTIHTSGSTPDTVMCP